MKCQRVLVAPLFPAMESKALGRKVLQLVTALGAKLEKLAPGEQPLYADILRQVQQRRPDLLILESAADPLTRRPWTAAERHLIDKCPCPVMLIRSSRMYSNPTVVAAIDPECAPGKPAELNGEILDAAGILSVGLRAQLVIFHAIQPWWDIVRDETALVHITGVLDGDSPRSTQERLEAEVEDLAREHELKDTRLQVVTGDPATCLGQLSRAASADILVMGFTHRSWLGRILKGHTSERTAAASAADLLIVKPQLIRAAQPSELSRPPAATIMNQLRPPARRVLRTPMPSTTCNTAEPPRAARY